MNKKNPFHIEKNTISSVSFHLVHIMKLLSILCVSEFVNDSQNVASWSVESDKSSTKTFSEPSRNGKKLDHKVM